MIVWEITMPTLAEILTPKITNDAVNTAMNTAGSNLSVILNTVIANPQASVAVVGAAAVVGIAAYCKKTHDTEVAEKRQLRILRASKIMADAIMKEVKEEFQLCASLMFSTELVIRQDKNASGELVFYTPTIKDEDFDLSKIGDFGAGTIGNHLYAFASKYQCYYMIGTEQVDVSKGTMFANMAKGKPDPVKTLIAKFAINTARMMSNTKLIESEVGIYFLKALYMGLQALAREKFVKATMATKNGLADFIGQSLLDLRAAWMEVIRADYDRASVEYLSDMRNQYVTVSRHLANCLYALMAKELVRGAKFDTLDEKDVDKRDTAWGEMQGTALQAMLYTAFSKKPTDASVVVASNNTKGLNFIQALEENVNEASSESKLTNFINHCKTLDVKSNGDITYRSITLPSGFSQDIVDYIHGKHDQPAIGGQEKQRRKDLVFGSFLKILELGCSCQTLLFAQEEARKYAKKYGDEGLYQLYANANDILKLFTDAHKDFKTLITASLDLTKSDTLYDIIASKIKNPSLSTSGNLNKVTGFYDQLKASLLLVEGRALKMGEAFTRWVTNKESPDDRSQDDRSQNDHRTENARQAMFLTAERAIKELRQAGFAIELPAQVRPAARVPVTNAARPNAAMFSVGTDTQQSLTAMLQRQLQDSKAEAKQAKERIEELEQQITDNAAASIFPADSGITQRPSNQCLLAVPKPPKTDPQPYGFFSPFRGAWRTFSDDNDYKNEMREDSLRDAAESGSIDKVERLLKAGTNVNGRGFTDTFISVVSGTLDKTALMLAARNNELHMVRYLVEDAKADLDLTDQYEYTALDYAIHKDAKEVVAYLASKKAKTNKYSEFLDNYLNHYADKEKSAKLPVFRSGQ